MKTKARRKGIYLFVLAGLVLAIAMALFIAPWASSSPDGLEKVANDKGFAESAKEPQNPSPTAGYSLPGVEEHHPALATALAGLAGTLAIFLIAWGLALLLKKKGGEKGATTVSPTGRHETRLPR